MKAIRSFMDCSPSPSSVASLRSGLLSHAVGTMRLNPTASFPREAQDARAMIKAWQAEQRIRRVK